MNPIISKLVSAAVLAGATCATWIAIAAAPDKGAAAGGTAAGGTAVKPALTVTLVQAQRRDVPLRFAANGSISAWQEAVLGAEVRGLRLSEVRAQVGDVVTRGQVLAVFAGDTVTADFVQARASVAEAEATLQDARANAERAQSIAASGALSSQQLAQYATAEKTAQARLDLSRAQLVAQQLRLDHTRVLARDDGVISARSATLGAVVPQGQELFRLIRKGRLEWRAEVVAGELGKLKPGLPVVISADGVGTMEGRLRVVAPTVDPVTRNALVYVDLPDAARRGFKPGMFARGEFALGARSGLTVPQDALVLRDGFSYVYRAGKVEGGQAKVARVKVDTGRHVEDRVEVLGGLKADERIVASGVAFLADGDLVKVVAK